MLEYDLFLVDCIDVFFCIDVVWVGVEVKLRKLDDLDIEWGVYQVVKYWVVLIVQVFVYVEVKLLIEVYLVMECFLLVLLQKIVVMLCVLCKVVEVMML